jgi:sugar (pentulose or hexulose) kinase
MRKNEPETFARIRKVFLLEDYLLLREVYGEAFKRICTE